VFFVVDIDKDHILSSVQIG